MIAGLENFSAISQRLGDFKGIPFASFVVNEGEGAAFIEPLPISMADSLPCHLRAYPDRTGFFPYGGAGL